MGIIEDRRRQLAQEAIEQVAREARNTLEQREASIKEHESALAARQCLDQSGFLPLLHLLLPTPYLDSLGNRDEEKYGWKSYGGATVSPPKRFNIGDYKNHKLGLAIHASLGTATVTKEDGNEYYRGSYFSVRFYPDGLIDTEAGPDGSMTTSVSALSQNPTLGEEVLERAYHNPIIFERRKYEYHESVGG